MSYFANRNGIIPKRAVGHDSYKLLDEKNGCVNRCSAGISVYDEVEYGAPGIHDDQEGFVVLSGSGWAKIGSEEQSIEPGTTFIAPKNTPHTIKSSSVAEPVMVFWFHAAV